MKLTKSETKFWNEYLASLSPENPPSNYFVESCPAGNSSMTDGLIALYLSGKKRAGSSLVEDFEVTGDPLPKVGNYWIVLDGKNQPKLILKTLKIEIHQFRDVPEYIAIAEGEGDSSLEYWKKTHIDFFKPFLASWDIDNIDDAHVITEFFELVWK
ncbi:MAG: ASCH domain-containing protein [Aliivibrio sp.]|uniref:ASCH domain-containing protein n=1 Tax=Aliivibrio sp. TaxID=1872443 RepID=UPI001A4FFA79|nr:ASCH domain-containing protein [Aliivibrio sp.]